MNNTFDPNLIKKKFQEELNYFLNNEPQLKADIEYVYKLIAERPKAYLMFEFAKVLGVEQKRIMPFLIVSDLMMDTAMNADDIIDDNHERFGNPTLWKIKGVNQTFMVSDYMYALIFSILKRHRPNQNESDFSAYQKSEDLLVDYFRTMGIAQYKTTISSKSLSVYTLEDIELLASQKASLLFQFCTSVPAYFSNKFTKELEDLGYQLGIARQYISDILDFMEVPGDHYKNGARMEDYFTHQPNLVLILTATSNKLSPEEKTWFYNNWSSSIIKENKEAVTSKVVELVAKTNAIEESKKELRRVRQKIQTSLTGLPKGEFKQNMSKWAFRSFPMD